MRKRISKRMMKLCAVILSILITFSQSGVLAYAEELNQGVVVREETEISETSVDEPEVIPSEEVPEEDDTDEEATNEESENPEAVGAGEENTEPVIAAEEENAESETAAEEENAEPVIAAEEEDAENENASEEGFEYTQAVDGVEIFVSAPKGVFPEGTTLQITKVDDDVQKEIDESIDEVREVKNVVASYTFDITFFNEDGEEIEPDTEQGKVSVFFNLAEAGNDMNDVSVYHTYENGDELETEVIENVNVETEDGVVECEELEGFSYYTVEFTYGGELRYVLNGDGEVELAVILEACELSDKGDVTAAVSSNEELFKAENRDGVWYVVSLKAFDTEESLVVTMGGYDYTIVVTDDPESRTYEDLRTEIQNAIQYAIENGESGTTVTLDKDYIGGGTGDVIDISNLNVTINLNGHTIDRGLTEATYNGCVFKVGNGKTLKIMDDSGYQGIITGGYSDSYGGGICVENGGTLELENGIITNNKVSNFNNGGAGVYVKDGHFIMTGGIISNNELDASGFSAYGGGVLVGGDSSFEMTGGIITGNTIGGTNAKGGGVYIYLSDGNNAKIGASAQITGNTCDSKSDNLFVGSPIEFTQDFADEANIGISTQSTLLNFSVNAPKGKEGAVVSDNPSEYIVEKYTDAGVEKVRLAPKKRNFKELQEKINTTSEEETESSSSDELAPVVPMAETGLTVARYVGNSKIAVPFLTGNTGKAGWGTISGLVAAHKDTTLNVTMNGYATVDNELLKNVYSQKVDLALNLDNNVTVVVPKQNNVILSALSVAGANNSNVFFRVSALTQKNVPEVAGHTTGLNFTDIQAIGGTSSTPVIKVVCSNTVNSFAKTKSIMLVIDTNTITDEKGRKIYAPGQDIYLYNGSRTAGVNCYLRGKVGKDGKVVFTVPMVNSYWTVGTKNLGSSLLHKNV